MPNYRRWYVPGATYFFTVVTCRRVPLPREATACRLLGDVMRRVRKRFPFETLVIVLLPDHLHCIWALPRGDADFSVRWNQIKRCFSEGWLRSGGAEIVPEGPRARDREDRGVWQRRFWEHLVRDEDDLGRCADCIHCNAVKHGVVARPRDWPRSSFERFVRAGHYPADWGRSDPGPMSWRGIGPE